jgi:hypothetical protein
MLYRDRDGEPELAIVQVPAEGFSEEDASSLHKLVTANLRVPVLLLSNNVTMVKLKPITNKRAEDLRKEEAARGQSNGKEGEEKEGPKAGAGREEFGGEREGVRKEDSGDAEADLRQSGSGDGDGGGEGIGEN